MLSLLLVLMMVLEYSRIQFGDYIFRYIQRRHHFGGGGGGGNVVVESLNSTYA